MSAAWPGATAVEVRDLSLIPSKRNCRKSKTWTVWRHITTAGFMATSVVFRDETPPEAVPDLFYQVRKKLADLRPKLPAGIMGRR